MSSGPDSSGLVLVVGATGNLGRELVRQLRAANRPVRALVRPESKQKAVAIQTLGVEICEGDLRDPESLDRACAGVSAVLAAAHAALGRGANRPQTVDDQGHRDLIEAARRSGVGHFVYAGAMRGADPPAVDFFRIKEETEERVQQSGMTWTVVRGAAFMETQLELGAEKFLESGKAIVFGRGDKVGNYVSVIDVACFMVLALNDARLHDRAIDVGGPENLTQSQVVDLYEKVIGRTAKRIRVPVPVLRTIRMVIGPFHSVANRMLSMLAYMATTDRAFDMGPLLQEFPMELTRFETVIERWYAERSAGSRAIRP